MAARLVVTRRRRGLRRRWSAQDDTLLRGLYPDLPTQEVGRRLNRTPGAISARAYLLGLAKSPAYLASAAACRLRRGDDVGLHSRFQKGHVPANKGLRRPGWGPGRMRETQFKKGVRRGVAVRLYKPIGTERMSKEGYLERKVNDALPLQARWRAVHLLVWEAAHGRVPRGNVVAFKNGDRTDIHLDNLELIHRRELMARNSIHNLPKPLADTIRLLGALRRQLNRRGTA